MDEVYLYSFVTIRIFARTELDIVVVYVLTCFVTIRIFARTEQSSFWTLTFFSFVTIRIFAGTDLKKEKGSVPPARTGGGALPPTFYCVNVN